MAVQKITFNQISNTGGLNGQVLAANSTAVYWKTISAGGFANGQSITVTNFVVTGNATIPGYETRATANSRLANTNSRITLVNQNLTGTNTALRTLISDRLQVANASATYETKSDANAKLANTNARINLVNSNLIGTNTALRSLINDRLQVANAVATYQTIATERAALANTNARITLVNQNLTGTNTALRGLISDRLQVGNATSTFETKSDANVKLANTNSYIATRASWTSLTGTNTALRSLISDRLQIANAAATYQTVATERAALANTNARITLVNSNLTGTNTALRTLISDRLQIANASTLYATKSNPTTSGFLDHTGRVSISTNLSVSGNTTIVGLIANGSLGTSGKVLKTNGTSVYWGTDTTGTGGGGGFSNGQSISVTNLVVTGNATVSSLIANGSLGASGRVLKTNGTTVYWAPDSSYYVPRVYSNTGINTLSWNSNNYEQYQLTAMNSPTTISADSGSPSNGQKMIFRLKDNGNARSITWTTGTTNGFRAIGVTLPTTTVVSKLTYVGCIFNSTDSRWDVISVAQET